MASLKIMDGDVCVYQRPSVLEISALCVGVQAVFSSFLSQTSECILG